MSKQFIQATCTKPNGDFILVSNLGFLDDPKAGITFAQAEQMVINEAVKAVANGYDVKWIREPFSDFEQEFYLDIA